MTNLPVNRYLEPTYSVGVHPLLTDYIKEIQIIKNDSPLIAPYKVYPGLFIVMGFQYRGQLQVFTDEAKMRLLKSCGMTGLLKTYRIFQAATSTIITILFKFYPWAVPKLLNIPAKEFTQQSIGLVDILGEKIIGNLQERMQAAQNPYSAVNIIQKFLVKLHFRQNEKIECQQRIIKIAQQLAQHPIIDSIENLANHYGYSKRSLERHFQEIIGLSPKRYVLTSRFQKVLQMLKTNAAREEEIAEYFSYHDQSHFIKDFKQFSGVTPCQFIKSSS